MRIFLVDGMVEIFRCFHGAPRASAEDGREVGAARALLHTMVALMHHEQVTHIAVAFDSIVDMPARAQFPRSADERALSSQYPLAAEIVRALGIIIWPMIRWQADDALATGAARFVQDARVEQIVICSNDNDFTQCLVDGRVVQMDRVRKRLVTADDVRTRFGIEPSSIPDYLALVGDKSDGLPGLPGWGHRSTSAVLARYQRVEDIPHDADAWDVSVRGASKLAATLAERYREALLYRNLSRLHTEVPLPDQVDDLAWRGAHRAKLEALASRIGASDALDRVSRWQ